MASRELRTMFKQNIGVSNKEHYGMLCFLFFWSGQLHNLLGQAKRTDKLLDV